jgi:3',5'-cyclic AMP phosphodiesterase CpdA
MNHLTFKNGRFKIIQIADAQEFPYVSPDTVRLIELAVEAEKPDLVIFTGDQIYGIHPKLWGKNAEARIAAVFRKLLVPVIAAGVPFAVTFGNHDAECGVPNARQAELYASLPGYLPGERMSDDVPGAFRIPICSEGDRHQFDVFCFDSRGSAAAGGRGVSDEQLRWFEEIRKNERDTGGAPPALVFQHIPVPEYYNVIDTVNKGTPGAVHSYGSRKDIYYALPQALREKGGFMKETPAVAGEKEFEVLKKDGGVLALAAGHDHNNSFVAPYEGIDLIYTQGAGFHVYGPHLKRGVRIFTLDEKDLSSYTTYTRTWESLTKERPKEFLLGYTLSKTPTSTAQAKMWIRRGAVAAAAGAAAAGTVAVHVLKKGKSE